MRDSLESDEVLKGAETALRRLDSRSFLRGEVGKERSVSRERAKSETTEFTVASSSSSLDDDEEEGEEVCETRQRTHFVELR